MGFEQEGIIQICNSSNGTVNKFGKAIRLNIQFKKLFNQLRFLKRVVV